jgi:hypothetical protein
VPASYGVIALFSILHRLSLAYFHIFPQVQSQAFHFWDGPGRRGDDHDETDPESKGTNFYENYAEDTKGKKTALGQQPVTTFTAAIPPAETKTA